MSDTGDTKTPDEIREEIEQTREELGETVEALGAKTDVKGRAQEKVDAVKADAHAKVDDVKESAQATADGGQVRPRRDRQVQPRAVRRGRRGADPDHRLAP